MHLNKIEHGAHELVCIEISRFSRLSQLKHFVSKTTGSVPIHIPLMLPHATAEDHSP